MYSELIGSICCLIFSSFLLQFSFANDTLSPGQSLRDGQTLVSAGRNFTLGFFSPGSTHRRYVGIWYTKVTVQTLVWVANRENPLTDSSGALKIGSNGSLVVLDGTGSSVWSSNVPVPGTNSTSKLLDSGNMVLTDGDSGRVLWQSFDHPTDMFFPGMKVGLDLKTGENQLFTSWKSPSDPSPGNFSFGFDPHETLQIFVWNGSIPLWRSGQWNGRVFTGIPDMQSYFIYGFNLIRDDQEGKMYVTFSTYNSSVAMRIVMNATGKIQQQGWEEGMEDWSVVWEEPSKECEFYNHCGAFGSCTENKLQECSCLKGFEPRSPGDWALGNWSGGCLRRSELECAMKNSSDLNGKADGFLRVERMKLPDSNIWLPVGDIEGCESECLKNCSCVAFAYLSGSGCMVWAGDLVDLRQFSGAGGEELYVRLAASDLGEKKRVSVVIIIVVVTGFVVIGVCGYFLWCKMKQREPSKNEKSDELVLFDLTHGSEASTNISNSNKSDEAMNRRNSPKLPLFDLSVITNATDNFCFRNKLGEGGFGPVYKGTLSSGREIAVKRLSISSGQGLEEFKNEVVLISKLQHRNLVRLLGCCIQEEKMLVYEYMPNTSLDAFLFDPNKRSLLDWGKRFHIIEGIARGLLYLHRDSTLRIIHRDLKASNILLDGEMNPKISDFGMARIFGGNQTQGNTNRVVGTYGYMSPEYAIEGLFSVKSDVFSFGVLLLEIVSGRRNTSFYHCDHSLNLLGYAWRLWNENKLMEMVDPSLGDSCLAHQVFKCIHVGLLCVQEDVEDRPTMTLVVSMLENESVTPPTPKQPAFSIRRRATSSPESNLGGCSINDVTISMVKGR